FCESVEAAAVVAGAASDRRMAKAQVKQNTGGAAAALEAYSNASTPNVIVLEAPQDRSALLDQLDELAHSCDAGTKVVVLGRDNDVTLYRQLIARGVSEYLTPPYEVVDFVHAISQLFRAPGAKPLGRVAAVVGAKGGVGASTVAHNLAWSLASVAAKATIVADFDLAFGTAGLDYNQEPLQGVAEAVYAPERVDAVLVDRLLAKCSDNLSLLAAPALLDKTFDFSETTFDTLLDAMRASTPWIVLDLPHLWSGWVRRTLIGCDEVVLVANPDLANLRNAKNLVEALKTARPNDHPPRLVLNGVGMLRRTEIAAADFTKTVGLKPIASIPHDAKLFGAAANNGRMIAEIEPKGKTAQIFDELASAVAGSADPKRAKKGLLDPLLTAFAWILK
ncbi:MAG TPA: AAA family ATPase, partial [Roseiarcus sp.]|nr:AAA family ATPase [Roseiarcus sp.]